MAINIKNEQTVDAVKKLAARHGVSYTMAIEMAVEEQVTRIAAEYREHLPAGTVPDEKMLYGPDGLYA